MENEKRPKTAEELGEDLDDILTDLDGALDALRASNVAEAERILTEILEHYDDPEVG